MPASRPLRQSFPHWQVRHGIQEEPPRGAKVIPFPGARARQATVVTYPRALTLPPPRAREQIEHDKEQRIAAATALAMTAALCVALALV